MSKEAMKQALEALEHVIYWDNEKPEWEYAHAAITALRVALAEQAQHTWVGLTDEEVKECFESVPTQDCQNYEHWRSLCARNIEAKLKDKNT